MHEPKMNVLDRCNAMNKNAQLNMHECSSILYFVLERKFVVYYLLLHRYIIDRQTNLKIKINTYSTFAQKDGYKMN